MRSCFIGQPRVKKWATSQASLSYSLSSFSFLLSYPIAFSHSPWIRQCLTGALSRAPPSKVVFSLLSLWGYMTSKVQEWKLNSPVKRNSLEIFQSVKIYLPSSQEFQRHFNHFTHEQSRHSRLSRCFISIASCCAWRTTKLGYDWFYHLTTQR